MGKGRKKEEHVERKRERAKKKGREGWAEKERGNEGKGDWGIKGEG